MDKIEELMLNSGINDNPDKEGIILFAELLLKDCISINTRNNDWRSAQEIVNKYKIN